SSPDQAYGAGAAARSRTAAATRIAQRERLHLRTRARRAVSIALVSVPSAARGQSDEIAEPSRHQGAGRKREAGIFIDVGIGAARVAPDARRGGAVLPPDRAPYGGDGVLDLAA